MNFGQQFRALVESEKLQDEARKVRRAVRIGGPRSVRQRVAAARLQIAVIEEIVNQSQPRSL